MPGFLYYLLIPISLLAVLAVLGTGIYAMFKGGDFNKKYSNKLMRLRITLQFIAIVIIMSALYFSTSSECENSIKFIQGPVKKARQG